jgi:hypothetical protein
MAKYTDSQETRMALAVLMGALVRSLDETTPGNKDRFCCHLEQTHDSAKGYDPVPESVLETIKWAHELVKVPRP